MEVTGQRVKSISFEFLERDDTITKRKDVSKFIRGTY